METFLLAIFLVTMLIGTGWILTRISWKRIHRQFECLATALNLELVPGETKLNGLVQTPPYLKGLCSGQSVTVLLIGRGMQKNRYTETAAVMETSAPKSIRFSMTKRSWIGRMAQRADSKLEEVEIENRSFMDQIRIKSTHPKLVSRLLTPSVQSQLLDQLGKTEYSLYLSKGILHYEQPGLMATNVDRESIQSVLATMATISETIQTAKDARLL